MKSLIGNKIDLIIFAAFILIMIVSVISFNLFSPAGDIMKFVKDSFGNLGGVIVGSFYFIWRTNNRKLKTRLVIVFSVGLGLVIYEFLQILIPWQTFDVKDIFGTFIGVVIASILNVLLMTLKMFRKLENSNIDE